MEADTTMKVDITGLPPEPPLDKLAGALAKAQGEFAEPKENHHVDFVAKTGMRVKYDYADLAAVMNAVRPALSKNGLSICHLIQRDGHNDILKTMLIHESGQSLASYYPIGNSLLEQPQTFGGKLSYARRYSVTSLLGISSESGNDLNEHEQPAPKQTSSVAKTMTSRSQTHPAQPRAAIAAPNAKNEAPATPAQVKLITVAAKERGVAQNELDFYMQNCYPGVTPSTLKRWQAEDILTFLSDPSVNAATLMAAAERARTEREIKQ